MRVNNKLYKLFNIALCIAYIPLSLISLFLTMASESTMDANNPLFIGLIDTFCVISFIIPLLCVVGVVLSKTFKRKGCNTWSFVVLILPLVIFVLNLMLLFGADFVPAVI